MIVEGMVNQLMADVTEQEPTARKRFLYDPCLDYHWAFRVYMACKTEEKRARWKAKLETIKSRIPKEGCP